MLATPRNVSAQTYQNATVSSGIDHTQYASPPTYYDQFGAQILTGGAAACDYDGDGYVDLFFTRMDAPDLLYHNNGNGTFTAVDPGVTGINLPSGSNGAVWGDINNDGKPDLYITTVNDSQNYLYLNNGNGAFTEQAMTRRVAESGKGPGFSATFGDYDNDGYLDLATASWSDVGGAGTRLFHNQGAANPGYFNDVTVAAGVDMSHGTTYQGVVGGTYAFSPRFSDLDHDGHVDLAITGDFHTTRLFWNNGNGTFTDGTVAAGITADYNGMGSAVGDFNGDGRLDWFVSAIYDPTVPNNGGWRGNGSQLYTNLGNRKFSATTMNTFWGWGSTFLDYDNDGKLDLAVTNGYNIPDEITTAENKFNHTPTLLYHNENGTLVDVGATEGVTDMDSGKGLLELDYDNDGKVDLLVVNNMGEPVLYHNVSTSPYDWIGFNTVGVLSNRDGYGAWLTVTDNGVTQDFEINAGSNFLGQNDKRAHFGLGNTDGYVDQVTVDWPSGTSQTFTHVPVDAYYTINELTGLSAPEPASLMLLAPAVLALIGRRPRRRQAIRFLSRRSAARGAGICIAAGVAATLSATARAENTVTEWNNVFTQTIRETAVSYGIDAGPGSVSRASAMMFGAMYDAVNSIDDTYQPYLVNLNVPATTSQQAAAASAAYTVMSYIYGSGATQQARFDTQLASDLSAIPDGPDKTSGINLGIATADAMIANRTNDGYGVSPVWTLNPAAGYWRPAFGQEPTTPGWGNVKPFLMTSGTQFRPGPPAGYSDMPTLLASPEYAQQVATVRQLGALNGSTRTPDQTEIAEFWANDRTSTYGPTGQLNEMTHVLATNENLSLIQTARLFAITNLTLADATIAAWDSKYDTGIPLWRPIDAIHETVDDGNPLTTPDPNWEPLALPVDGFPAPAFPSYVAGHAVCAGAQAAVLAAFFGTDDISFSLTSDSSPATRSFTSFSQAAQEMAMSRVYIGVHYTWDVENGFVAGTDLGDYAFSNFLQPVPEPSSFIVAAGGIVALLLKTRRRRRSA